MTKTLRNIRYLVCIALFLLIISIVLYYKNLNNEVLSGLLGTIIGGLSAGLLAGFFALYGVKLTLDYQQLEQQFEIESHEKMFRIQLEFTHNFIDKLSSKGKDGIYGGRIVYDSDWHKHLQYISLDDDNLRTVIDWFHLVHRIEIEANITHKGIIAADAIPKIFKAELDELLPGIKKIIMSDSSIEQQF